MKRKKVISLTVIAVLVLSLTATAFAWLLSHDKITDRLTTDSVNVYMQELNWKDENGEQLRIGDTVSKNPTVTANDGDIYFAVTMHIRDKNGNEITDKSVLDYIDSFIYYDPDGKLKDGVSYTTAELDALKLDSINPQFVRDGNTFYFMTDGEYTKLLDDDSVELFTNIVVPCDITKKEWIEIMSPLEKFAIDFKVKAVLANSFDELDGSNPSEVDKALKN